MNFKDLEYKTKKLYTCEIRFITFAGTENVVLSKTSLKRVCFVSNGRMQDIEDGTIYFNMGERYGLTEGNYVVTSVQKFPKHIIAEYPIMTASAIIEYNKEINEKATLLEKLRAADALKKAKEIEVLNKEADDRLERMERIMEQCEDEEDAYEEGYNDGYNAGIKDASK